MRILFAAMHFGYVHGGGEYYPMHIARVLKSQGHHAPIFCGRDILRPLDPVARDFTFHTVPIFYWLREVGERKQGKLGLILRSLHYLVYAMGMFLFLVTHKKSFDVIDAHDVISLQAALWAKRFTHIPVVVTMHGRPQAMELRLLRRVDATISVNEQYAEELRKDGYANVSVVPVGLDLDVFKPGDQEKARAACHVDRDIPLLLFAGRLIPMKNPLVLVEMMLEVKKEMPSALLWIVGDGVLEGEVRREIAKHGLEESVRIFPHTAPANLATMYQAADVFVLPSFVESFSMVALEAYACGTPVAITNNAHGFSESIPASTFEAFDPKSLSDFVKAVKKALKRSRKAQEQYKVVQDFSWENRSAATLAVLKEVAK
ncbi:MAG TPA: glycosyltransferase family 4 protein [Verrucomicrobiae bacterium]|nr:glycosyltransferase family 4 protein [Verrucomicrobiae bacterium]